MDLRERIVKRMAQAGQVLGLLAALLMAVNAHPVHAEADASNDHGHFGLFCDMQVSGDLSHDGDGDVPNPHGDCTHHFHPIVATPAHKNPEHLSAADEPLYKVSTRQMSLTFDPPPPRNSS